MSTRLPAAPLLAAVDAAVGRPRPGWTARLRRGVGESGVRAYERAQREGSLTLRRIEQFCDRFGWHPRELYATPTTPPRLPAARPTSTPGRGSPDGGARLAGSGVRAP